MKMQLVEQHVISQTDPRFKLIDDAAFRSKHLYNAANYEIRQHFFNTTEYLNNTKLFHRMKHHEAYKALPRKVSNDILRLLDKNWRSFFKALKGYKEDPSKFLGRPRLPKYQDKDGRNILIYDIQALSKTALKKGVILPSQLVIAVQTKHTNVDQVRIVPRGNHYVVEVVYEQKEQQSNVDPTLVAAIDIGLDYLATLTSNKPGLTPRLVNGRPLKSINQYYNKQRAKLQSKLGNRGTSPRIEQFTNKRTRKINHYLHTQSHRIIEMLISEGIGTLVIGKNPCWKQEIKIGKRNNQNFVNISHARFIDMLTYKAKLVGIAVIITEESYTSKASFLDLDKIPKYDPNQKQEHKFSGKRVKRGLYRAKNGRRIHADVNGSYNIQRKAFPKSFEQGIEGLAVGPVGLPTH
jgi:putative transposase